MVVQALEVLFYLLLDFLLFFFRVFDLCVLVEQGLDEDQLGGELLEVEFFIFGLTLQSGITSTTQVPDYGYKVIKVILGGDLKAGELVE